jgi:hypothetical protein
MSSVASRLGAAEPLASELVSIATGPGWASGGPQRMRLLPPGVTLSSEAVAWGYGWRAQGVGGR